jgi:tRNA A-37 threonylcarbamoyl transferase component Bud32
LPEDRIKLEYTDPSMRGALEGRLELLCHPELHEGKECLCVKSNPSRTVWRCLLDGQGYYLKHYHSRDVWHRLGGLWRGDEAWREAAISHLLRAAGAASVEVVAVGRTGKRSWMLSREVAPAVPLNIWHDRLVELKGPGDAAARRVGGLLAEQLGRLHALKLFHGDLHAGNILLKDPDGAAQPVLMDLHRLRRCRRMRKRLCALDLAMLMHDRLAATTASERLAFLRRYLRAAGHSGTLRGWAAWVMHLAYQHRRQHLAARDRRTLRPGKYFAPVRLSGGWRGTVLLTCKRASTPSAVEGRTFTVEQWREALVRLLPSPQEAAGMAGARQTLTLGGHSIAVCIKRNRGSTGLRALADRLRPSGARRAFRLGHALVARRIPALLPLAVLERRGGGGRRESILVTEALEDAVRLNHLVAGKAAAGAEEPAGISAGPLNLHRGPWPHLPRQLGWLLHTLHAEGFAYDSLEAADLLCRGAGDDVVVVLADLEGLSRPWRLTRRRQFEALMRLNASLLDCPAISRAGRLRMLLQYLRHSGVGRATYKSYWRALQRWSLRTWKEEYRRQHASGAAGGAATRSPGE